MSAAVLPRQCSSALKEWATVLEAMTRGEQLVLIRKGGLIEPGQGFSLQARAFLFYPTFEHQAVNYLRPSYQPYFRDALAHRAPEGKIRVELCGLAHACASSQDPALLDRLSPYHIYNPSFLTQRLQWQPEQPLTIVVVRVFRLALPHTLEIVPRYAGCRSWIDLEAPLSLERAQPVLSDAEFETKAQELTTRLA